MSWYVWKRWRFALAVGESGYMAGSVVDGHGIWVHLCGRVFFLRTAAKGR